MKKLFELILLVIVFSTCVLLIACEDSYNEPSKNELLAGSTADGKRWNITLIEVELGSIRPFPCVKDNNITYFPDGRYEVNEGQTKCDPSDPPAYVGSWSFNRSKTQLTIIIGDSLKVYALEQIDFNNHRITAQFNEGPRTYILKSQ